MMAGVGGREQDVVEHGLGPMPEPRIESGEPGPGGVDAVTATSVEPIVPDLPAGVGSAGSATPPGLRLSEDTSTEATEGDRESPD